MVSSNTLRLVSIGKSPRPDKKLVAVFDISGKRRSVHFGARGYGDYTIYHAKDRVIAREKREHYIARHSKNGENWKDPTTPGALSRFILWEKPTVSASVAAFKKKFRL